MRAILHVCTTCRAQVSAACDDCTTGGNCAACPLAAGDDLRPGGRLYRALLTEEIPKGVEIRPVECLSACSEGCSVALSAPGKWCYVYGRMTAANAVEILEGAARYAASADGLVPWRERPTIFRKQSLARIPPQE